MLTNHALTSHALRKHGVQAAAEEARFECARKLTELESRKRYEFVEAMTSSMEAHLRFYERGHEVCPVIPALITHSKRCVE